MSCLSMSSAEIADYTTNNLRKHLLIQLNLILNNTNKVMVKAITLKSRLRWKDVLKYFLFMSQWWVSCVLGGSCLHSSFHYQCVFLWDKARQASTTLCKDAILEDLVLLSPSPITVMNHHAQLPPLLYREFQSKVKCSVLLGCHAGLGLEL